MTVHKTLILGKKEVARLITMKEAIRAVEFAFRETGERRVRMPAKIYLDLPDYGGDFRAMPAYIEKLGRCSLKWVNSHPYNAAKGLPAVMAVIILSDPLTGYPLCVMDGTYVTCLRTGAAGAVAAKYLADPKSRTAGLVGCGAQARAQLAGLLEIFPLRDVKVWGPGPSEILKFIRENARKGVRMIPAGSVRQCVADCDIVVTTTPSRKPLVRAEWLKRGVHVNAIGADAKGKQELDPAVLKKAKVVVDSWEQASHSGEINVPVSRGILIRGDIYAELGDILSGRRRGRVNSSEITVFDSTGLAVQDLAAADVIYRNAVKSKRGRRFPVV